MTASVPVPNARCGRSRQPIRRRRAFNMGSQMFRELVQNYLLFLCLILSPRRFTVKERFAVGNQRRELIFETHEVSICLAQIQTLASDLLLQSPTFSLQLSESRVARQPDRPVSGVQAGEIHAQDRRKENLRHRLAGYCNRINPFRAGEIELTHGSTAGGIGIEERERRDLFIDAFGQSWIDTGISRDPDQDADNSHAEATPKI